jgi:DNA-binding transcriptional LysR family regulator
MVPYGGTRAQGLGRGEGGGMRTSAPRWTAGSVAVASVALMAAGLGLAFADRHDVPAQLTNWDFSDVAGDLEDLTIPGLAYLVASRRPRNPARSRTWWRWPSS